MTWYFYNNRGVLQQDGLEDPFPVGLITSFVSDQVGVPVVPTNWLLCDGTSYPTASYPDLADKLAAPPGNFNVPNLNAAIPVGAGGAYNLNTKDTSAARSSHTHGGASPTTHNHTQTHVHSVPDDHRHKYNHQHDADHTHGTGTLNIQDEAALTPPPPGNRETVTLGPPNIHSVAKGAGPAGPGGVPAQNGHDHTISGSTGNPRQSGGSDIQEHEILATTGDIYTGYDGAVTSTGSAAIVTQDASSPITNAADVLPPYLNVYFIIKAVDTGGSYI